MKKTLVFLLAVSLTLTALSSCDFTNGSTSEEAFLPNADTFDNRSSEELSESPSEESTLGSNSENSAKIPTVETHIHSFGAWATISPATCAAEGQKKRSCSSCGKEELQTIAKLNTHNYANDVCTVCGRSAPSEGLSFELINNTYTLVGMGTCTDSTVVIPETYNNKKVTAIANSAIDGSFIREIIIPDSITAVDNNAISCYRFCKITVGKNAVLAENAISTQTAIELVYLSSHAYESCMISTSYPELISVHRENQASNVVQSDDGFLWMTVDGKTYLVDYRGSHTNLNLSDSLGGGSYEIAPRAFYQADIQAVTIGDAVTALGEAAFCESRVTSVHFNNMIETIPSFCFYGCTELTTIEIPDSVTTIAPQAFYESGLQTVTIGTGVSSIDVFAFGQCAALDTLYFNASNSTIFSNALGTPRHVVIGETVSVIPKNFMKSNTLLQSITFAENSRCHTIHQNAFEKTAITEVTIPATVTFIGAEAFKDCDHLETVYFLAEACNTANKAFYGCDQRISLFVGEGTTKLPKNLFYSTFLNSVIFAENSHCQVIESSVAPNSPAVVQIPAGIKQLDSFRAAETLIIDENNPYLKLVDHCLIDITEKKLLFVRSADFAIPVDGSVTVIGSGAFTRSDITNIVIPDCIETIESGAIRCTNLKRISLPFLGGSKTENQFLAYIFGQTYASDLTEIQLGAGANIISYYIPSGLTTVIFRGDTLGEELRGMKTLTTVSFSADLNLIAETAFRSCPNITDIYFGGSEEQWNALKESGWLNYIRASTKFHLNEEPANE